MKLNKILILLLIAPLVSFAGGPDDGFNESFELQGITFQVKSDNSGSINELTITPNGLSLDNSVITHEIDGTVTGAEIADIDWNGSPEIYVYINSAGSGSYGSVVAYSANNKKSLSRIYLPPLTDNEGYMGHDQYAVVETRFHRQFPVYLDGDINAKPTGGLKVIQYKLIPGEASWVMKLFKTDVFKVKKN